MCLTYLEHQLNNAISIHLCKENINVNCMKTEEKLFVTVFTSHMFWFSLYSVHSGCVWIVLIGWLTGSLFSVAACREWWFCLHGCLQERANVQICERTADVLAQTALVRALIYVNHTRILLKVSTCIWVTK